MHYFLEDLLIMEDVIAWITKITYDDAPLEAAVFYVSRNACTPMEKSSLLLMCHYPATRFFPRVEDMMVVYVYQ